MTTTPNITVNIFNYGSDPDADALVSQGLAAAAAAVAPDPARPVPVPRIPISQDQRRALFGAWRRAFPDVRSGDDRVLRLAFTRAALDMDSSDPVSWSSDRNGSITSVEAEHLIRLLNTISDIV